MSAIRRQTDARGSSAGMTYCIWPISELWGSRPILDVVN